MSNTQLDKMDSLIYEFLFGEKTYFEINMSEYCKDNERHNFRDTIRKIIIKGGKKIIEDRTINRESNTIWRIELK